MPNIAVNNGIINTFQFSATFDLYNKRVIFDTSASSYAGSSGSGIFSVTIAFQLIDQQGVVLADVDWNNPQIPDPSSDPTYTLDLSSLSLPFLFQTYKITGYIKDSNGNVYQTATVYKNVCQPVGINESGYVPGLFQIIPNCVDNVLTVKELTPFIYNNKKPDSVTKSGTLSYPTGTISAITFTSTPFSNNVIYTGEYRVNCTSEAIYDLGDQVYALVTYITNNVFPVTCSNILGDLSCCLAALQQQYIQNCNNAIGKQAQQTTWEILLPLMEGIIKQFNGQDASSEIAFIKKKLNCDCGSSSLRQNEFTPINPATTSIVLSGAGGTTVPSPTVTGNTKNYSIASNIYQVVKGDTGDLAYTIEVDTSTQYVIKYKLTFNYSVMAGYILTAISEDAELLAQLNSLIQSTGNVNLTGLDGKCIIDLSSVNAFLTQNVTDATKVISITTNTQTFTAPPNLFASNVSAVQSWLNGLGIGTFTVTLSGTFAVLSLNNTFNLSALNFSAPDLSVPFQKTNATIVTVLQAIIDYLCALNASQILLNQALSVYQFDYNGNIVATTYQATDSQEQFNYALSISLKNIFDYVDQLTGITCAKIAAVFSDSPNAVFGASARLYGTDGNGCVSWTNKQIALAVIAAINENSDVKVEFCAIDCETPGGCPEPTDINMAIVSGNIGIYGVSWSQNPLASQSVTVQYKLSSDSTWLTATSALTILPNGNINGVTPFQIGGLSSGETYDVKIVNNCGGTGFVKQITTPTGTVYTGDYIYDPIIYNICGNTPVTLYTSAPFGVGVIVYTNLALTIPLTGNNYIADSTGEIYTINPSTGLVLSDTGTSCDTGTPIQVILGNSTGSICAGSTVTRYLNGVSPFFGQILYVDAGLTTPQTGYAYFVLVSSPPVIAPAGNIINLNSITGIIGASTGLSCSVYSHSLKFGSDDTTACAAGLSTVYSSAYFGAGVQLFTDAALTIPKTGYLVMADPVTGLTYNVNPTTGTITSLDGGSCF